LSSGRAWRRVLQSREMQVPERSRKTLPPHLLLQELLGLRPIQRLDKQTYSNQEERGLRKRGEDVKNIGIEVEFVRFPRQIHFLASSIADVGSATVSP